MPRRKKIIIEPEKLGESRESAETIAPLYSVILRVNGEELKGEGETIDAAILSIKPIIFKTNAFLLITHGEKKAEIRFSVARIKRLFYNDIFRKIMAETFRRRLSF